MIQAELDYITDIANDYYSGGLVLDVGSSTKVFRTRPKFPYDLSPLFDNGAYKTFDCKGSDGVDIVGDAARLSEYVAPGSVSFLLCNSLLEHVPQPWVVVREIARVLTVGGVAVISVPWQYMPHPDPIDCYRISKDGMRGLTAGLLEEVDCREVTEPAKRITVTMFAGIRSTDEEELECD